MNSKIRLFNSPPTKVEITDAKISGPTLARKLEAWCEAEPSILMWEISFDASAVKSFFSAIAGRELETSGLDWRIDFHIIRSNSVSGNKQGVLYDGVAVIAGFIKNTTEIIDEKTRDAYLLSLNSKSFKAEKSFISSIDLWNIFVRIGQIVKQT